MTKKTAVVVGALGVIGRYIVDRLAAEPGWKVVGLSRRQGEDRANVRYLSVDLLDAHASEQSLAQLTDATHMFYCAFQATGTQAADYARGTQVNLDMLVNSVSAIEAVAKKLTRVVLVTGTKYYGSHLGAFRTPAKETDARHMPPDFYFDQIDWLTARQSGKPWTWAELRPQTLCGFAPGTAMSIIPVIAVYAAISKQLGLPLRFPGTQACFDAVCQMTDARILAQAMRWAATEPRAANQSFNIVNGDLFRWKNLWEKLARHFGMENGGVQTVPLAKLMADKEPLWASIVKKHGLRPLAMAEIANWTYADSTFSQGWDHISSPMKSRLAGFQACIDTEDMFIEHLERFRMEKVIP